jgi:hypothetical protein
VGFTREYEKKIIIQGNEILLPFPIKSILDSDDVLIIYSAPTNESDYFKYIEILETIKTANIVAINKAGKIIWEYSNRFIANIKKVQHQSSLILLKNISKVCENKYDLLIDCRGWNFYINPETGEKIREEQTK